MAFCRYCGKQLADGEVCSCRTQENASEQNVVENAQGVNNEAPVQNQEQVQNVAQEQAQSAVQGQPQVASQGVNSAQVQSVVNDVVNDVKVMFKNPSVATAFVVQRGNVTHSVILIALQAILSGFMGLFVTSSINKLLGVMSFLADGFEVSGAKVFFLTLLFSALFSVILAGLYMGVIKLMKGNITFQQSLALAAVKATVCCLVIVLSYVLYLIKPGCGIGCYYLAFVVALFFLFNATDRVEGLDRNKAIYAHIIVCVVFVLVFVLLGGKLARLYVPSEIKNFNPSTLMRGLY